MIKVILLKDAVADRGVAYVGVVVESNGFSIEIMQGHIKKDKAQVLAKGTAIMELPDMFIDRLYQHTESFTPEGSDEVKEFTYIRLK